MASQTSAASIRRKSKTTEEGGVGVQSLLSELGAKLQSIQIATSGRSSLADGASRQSSLTPSAAGDAWPAAGGEELVRSRRTTRLLQAGSDAASTLPAMQPTRSISRRSTAHDFMATAPGRVASPGLISRRTSQLDFGAGAASTAGTARASPVGYGASLSRRSTTEQGVGMLNRSRRATGEEGVLGGGLGLDPSGVSLDSLSSKLPPPATSWSRRTSRIQQNSGGAEDRDSFVFTGKGHPLAALRNQLLAADPTPDTPVFMGAKSRPAPWDLPGDSHAEGQGTGGVTQEGHPGATGAGHGPSRLGGALSRRATANAFEAAGRRSTSPFLSGASSTSSPDVAAGPSSTSPTAAAAAGGGGGSQGQDTSSPAGGSPNMMLVKSALQDLATRMQQLPMSPLEQVLWQQRQHHLQLLGRAMGALGGLSVDVDVLLQRCAMADLQANMLADAANVSDQQQRPQGPSGQGGSSAGGVGAAGPGGSEEEAGPNSDATSRSSGGGTAAGQRAPGPAAAAAEGELGRHAASGSLGVVGGASGPGLLPRTLSSSPLGGRRLSTSRLGRQPSGTGAGLEFPALGAAATAAAGGGVGGPTRSRSASPTSPRRTRTSTSSLPVMAVSGPAASSVVSPFLQHQQEEATEGKEGPGHGNLQQQQQQQEAGQEEGLPRAGSFGFGQPVLQAAGGSFGRQQQGQRQEPPGADGPAALGSLPQQQASTDVDFEAQLLAAEEAAPGRRLSDRGQLLHDLKYGLVELVQVVEEASGLASSGRSSQAHSSRAVSGASLQGAAAAEGGVDDGTEEAEGMPHQPARSSSSGLGLVAPAPPVDDNGDLQQEQQQLALGTGSTELPSSSPQTDTWTLRVSSAGSGDGVGGATAAAIGPAVDAAAVNTQGQGGVPRIRPVFKLPTMDLSDREPQEGEHEATPGVVTPVLLLGGAGDPQSDTGVPSLVLSRQASKKPSARLSLQLQAQGQEGEKLQGASSKEEEEEDDFEAAMRREEAAARAAAGIPDSPASSAAGDRTPEAAAGQHAEQQQQQQQRLSSSSSGSGDFEAALRRQEAEAAPSTAAAEGSEEDFKAGLRRQEAEARAGHLSDTGDASDDDFEAALRRQEQEAAAAAGVQQQQLGGGSREGSEDFEAAMRRQEMEACGERLSDSGSDDFEAALRKQEEEAAAAAGTRKRTSSNAGSGGGHEAEAAGYGGAAGAGGQGAISSSSSEDFEAALRRKGETAGAGARKRSPQWDEETGEERQDGAEEEEGEDFEAGLRKQEAEARDGHMSDSGSDDFEAAMRKQEANARGDRPHTEPDCYWEAEDAAQAGRPPSSSSSDDFEAAMRKQEANARGDRARADPECYWEDGCSESGDRSSGGVAGPSHQAAAPPGDGNWEGAAAAPPSAPPAGAAEGEGGGGFNIPQLNLGRVGSIGDMQGLALSPRANALVGMGSYSPDGWAAQQAAAEGPPPWEQQQEEGEEEEGGGLQVGASRSSSDTPPPPVRPPAAAAAAAKKAAPVAATKAKPLAAAAGSGSGVIGSIVRNRAGGLDPKVAAALAAGIEAVKQEQAAAAAAAAAKAASDLSPAALELPQAAGIAATGMAGAAGQDGSPDLRRTQSPQLRLSDTSDASDPASAAGRAFGAQQHLQAPGQTLQQQEQPQVGVVPTPAEGLDEQAGGMPQVGPVQTPLQAAVTSSSTSSRQPSLQQSLRLPSAAAAAGRGLGDTQGPGRLPSQHLRRASTSKGRSRGDTPGRHPAAAPGDAYPAEEEEMVVSGSDTAEGPEASTVITGSGSDVGDAASWQAAPTPSDVAASECGQSEMSQEQEWEEEAGFGSMQACGPAGAEQHQDDEEALQQQEAGVVEPQQQPQQQQQQQQQQSMRRRDSRLRQSQSHRQQQQQQQQQQQEGQEEQQQQQAGRAHARRRSPVKDGRGTTPLPPSPLAEVGATMPAHHQQQLLHQQQQQQQAAALGGGGWTQPVTYTTFSSHSSGSSGLQGPWVGPGDALAAAAAEQQLGYVLQLLAQAQALAARSDALKQQQQRVASSAMSAAGEAVVGVWSALTSDPSLVSQGGSVTSVTSEAAAHQQQQLELASVLSDAADAYGKQAAAARLQAVSLLQQAVAALALLPGGGAGGLNLQGLLPAAEAMLQQQEAAVAAAAAQSVGALQLPVRAASPVRQGAAASPVGGAAAGQQQQQAPQEAQVGAPLTSWSGVTGGITGVTRGTSPTPMAAASAPGAAASFGPVAGGDGMASGPGSSMGSAAAPAAAVPVDQGGLNLQVQGMPQQQQQQQFVGSGPAASQGPMAHTAAAATTAAVAPAHVACSAPSTCPGCPACLGSTVAHIASATAAAATAAACQAVRQVPGGWVPTPTAAAAAAAMAGSSSTAGVCAGGAGFTSNAAGLGSRYVPEAAHGCSQAVADVWPPGTPGVLASSAAAAAEAGLGSPSQMQALLDAQAQHTASVAAAGVVFHTPGSTPVMRAEAGPPSLAQQLAAAEAALQALERRAAKGATQEQVLGKKVKKQLQHLHQLQKSPPLAAVQEVEWEEPLPPPCMPPGGSCFVSPQLRERSMYGSSRRQGLAASGRSHTAAHLSPAAAVAGELEEHWDATSWYEPVYVSSTRDWPAPEAAAATWQPTRPSSSSRRPAPPVSSSYAYSPQDMYGDSSCPPAGLGSSYSSRWGYASGLGAVRTAAPIISSPCRTCGSPVPMTAPPVAPVSPGVPTSGTWVPTTPPTPPSAAAAVSAATPGGSSSRGRATGWGATTPAAAAAAAAAAPVGAPMDAATLHLLRSSLEAVKLERLALQAEQPLLAARTRQAADEARVLSLVLTDFMPAAPAASWQ